MPTNGLMMLLCVIGLLTSVYFIGSFLDFVTDYFPNFILYVIGGDIVALIRLFSQRLRPMAESDLMSPSDHPPRPRKTATRQRQRDSSAPFRKEEEAAASCRARPATKRPSARLDTVSLADAEEAPTLNLRDRAANRALLGEGERILTADGKDQFHEAPWDYYFETIIRSLFCSVRWSF